MFGWEFPPHQAGGLATATVGLVKGLLRVGAQVTLVVPFPVEENAVSGLRLVGAPELVERLSVHRIPSPLQAYGGEQSYQEVFAKTVERRPAAGGIYGPDLLREVDRFAAVAADIADAEPHDVIDAHDWITFEAGLAARNRSGRPLVAHIHAIEFDRTGSDGNPAIAGRERDGLARADRVIANSHRLKKLCADRYQTRLDKVDVVHWGIDESAGAELVPVRKPLGRNTPIVLFLGRVTSQKGPDVFLEMAARVAQFDARAHFVVAGSGDMLTALIERAAELGIADRVHFTGGLGTAEVVQAFRMADVCVMPSRSEPFGLVALESLANGTPCIMPRDAGVAEVVSNAFKVDCWDVDELTNKVVAILRHPSLRAELSDRGRGEVALPRFALDEPARLTLQSYQRALAQRS